MSANAKTFSRVLLFGGESATLFAALEAKKRGLETIVFTDPFRLDKTVHGNLTLRQCLAKAAIDFHEVDSISKALLAPYVTPQTVGLSVVTFWIFRSDVIELFDGRLFNFHGARLPEERGGGTFSWKILSGERNGGMTIHSVAERIDEGEIVLEARFRFPESCRLPVDYMKVSEGFGEKLLAQFLAHVSRGRLPKGKRQIQARGAYFPLLNTLLNGWIDWRWTAKEIERFSNAFDDPYPGAQTLVRGKVIHLKKCELLRVTKAIHPFQAGLIIRRENDAIFVAAQGGIIRFGEVVGDIRIGDRLYTPSEHLDLAMTTRAAYGPQGLKNPLPSELR